MVPKSTLLSNPTLRGLLAVVFFTYVAQNMLNVSIAPLARELGLVEWAIGLAISLAALSVTLFSQFWGRRSMHWGRRRVLLFSLTLALIAGSLFAVTVWARAAGLLTAVLATVLIVVARGPFFGSAVSAIPPTGQALIAQITPNESARVRGMAAFSGAVNLSIMAGSVLSSALGAWWIFGPVYATPLFILVALAAALRYIPRTEATKSKELPPKVSWRDRRILPWIASGFGIFFTNGVVQIVMGFVAQDRLNLEPQAAIPVTGGLLLASATGAMTSQLVLVPRLNWPPRRLVRIGLTLGLVMTLVLTVATALWQLALANLLLGLSFGLVGPGYSSGGSLSVTSQEQGGVAGVLNAASAVTWIFAPVSATALYTWNPVSPFLLAAGMLLVSVLVAWTHPLLRARRYESSRHLRGNRGL